MSPADAIVVLGCRVLPSGRLGPPAQRRAAAGARAFLDGVAPLVIASGGRRWEGKAEARALRDAMVRAGVPGNAVLEELCSLSTWENAVFSAALLRRLSARRAVIVTCAWHVPRALSDFRAAGVDAWALPVERPPVGLTRRLYERAHEATSRRLDARAVRTARAIRVAAEGA